MTSWSIFLAALLVVPVVAGLVVSALCAVVVMRDQKPPWLLSIPALAAGMLALLLPLFGSDAWHPSRWGHSPAGSRPFFAPTFVSSIFLSTVVVLVLVSQFRERYRRHLSISERRRRRRQRREKYWHRARWVHLVASAGLTMALIGLALLSLHPRGEEEDYSVADVMHDSSGEWIGRSAPPPPKPGNRPHKPLVDISVAAAFLCPFYFVGMIGSGFWFARTLAYWRGYLQVPPRHRRDFLPHYRPPSLDA